MKNNNINTDNRTFGRVKSRKLNDNQIDLIKKTLPKYKIDKIYNINNKVIHLEIGFGFGDFIFENAKRNPNILYIGCELYINGILNLLKKLEKEPLDNLKIYQNDARILLQNCEDKIFDRIYILFPDPWPKRKQFKRRLITNEFLNFLSLKLKDNSEILISTDHESYKEWILNEISKNKLFIIKNKDYLAPDYWVKTKYEKKAEIEKRENMFFILVKLYHP